MSPYQLDGKYYEGNSSAKGALFYCCQVSRFELQIQLNGSHTIKWSSSWFSNDHLSWRTVLVIETLTASALFSVASVSFPKLNSQISYLNYRRPHHSLDLNNEKRIRTMEWSMVLLLVYWSMVLVNPTITIIRNYWRSLWFSDDNLSWRAILVCKTFSTSRSIIALVSYPKIILKRLSEKS